MKQIFTILLFLALIALPVSAGEPAVKLVFTDGTYGIIQKSLLNKILLNEIIDEGTYVLPVYNDESIHYPACEKSYVARIELNADLDDDAIRSQKDAASLIATRDMVSAQSLPAGTTLGIYSADGRCVAQQKASNGNANISISGFSHGTYIVRAGNVSFKFMK